MNSVTPQVNSLIGCPDVNQNLNMLPQSASIEMRSFFYPAELLILILEKGIIMSESHDVAMRDSELSALRKFRDRVSAALTTLEQELAELRASEEVVEPDEVLVRTTPGPPVSIVHAVDNPCKRVRSRDSYKKVSYRFAVERGWTKCTACNWGTAS
ncbi:hypothetical protein [Intrasporangium chromatireducens]|uniref:hypothetical protein n=1 Tax=Intrasporangium chromatireducens TaxID=1386088 RepID=UPI0012DC8772|nr:hypothetical protein [Intrasporangium chromatireducens]